MIAIDGKFRTMQRLDTLDAQQIRIDTGDFGAHGIKQHRQLRNMRFTGGIADQSRALCQRRRLVQQLPHHQRLHQSMLLRLRL